ncbi:unnamed protein product [Chrysoparadoxa australica]
MATLDDATSAAAPPAQGNGGGSSWVDEALGRYSDPAHFGTYQEAGQEPDLVEEKRVNSTQGQLVLKVFQLVERTFWNKVMLHFVFAAIDVEDTSRKEVLSMEADTWTGEIKVYANGAVKHEEHQKQHLTGGSWGLQTQYGQVHVGMSPGFWKNTYTLALDGTQVFTAYL